MGGVRSVWILGGDWLSPADNRNVGGVNVNINKREKIKREEDQKQLREDDSMWI